MFQNRVNPLGEIVFTKARGHWMGNRGHLHDNQKQIIRSFKLKAWLTCLLEFNGRKREVMAANRYTELFFLDEATAFAAGHRPCFECRRKDFIKFKSYWLKGNADKGFNERISINEIDNIIHKERIDKHKNKVTYEDNLKELPDGTFIFYNNKPHLIAKHFLHEWTSEGYTSSLQFPKIKNVTVLTPKSIVNAFRAGYVPQMQLE